MPQRPSVASLSAMRGRSRALLGLVLPALVLRALIPFGFMPVAGNGGPTMELCPGAMAAGGHGPMHHEHSGGSLPGSAHALCVFAASAAPALAPVVLAAAPAADSSAAGRAADPASLQLPTILRAQAARAPPSLA
jgi:hypothetical protein